MRRQRARSRRWAGLFVVLAPVSCALTVGYDGYEKASSSGSGGTSGDAGGGLGGCFPISCGSPGAKCGTVSDQCGDTLTCPACPPGKTCAAGECKDQADCGNGVCEPGESCATCVDCKCDDTICVGTTCCVPDCTGKDCGPDGCGSFCGPYCPTGQQCDATGHCIGQANCGDTLCGNGPDESCETCADCACLTGGLCLNHACCAPDCAGKDCGDDGCGTSCGDCSVAGEVCDPKTSKCVPQAECGNKICEVGEDCNLCQGDCTCMTGACTPAGTCCVPQCQGKECGSDQCGSLCGACTGGQTCNAEGLCVVSCGDGVCTSAENCGNCAADCGCKLPKICTGGVCCTPNCSGKICGPDGCGGMCPPGCPANNTCQGGTSCQPAVGCPDGTCTPPENCATCPNDCQPAAGLICCTTGPFAGQAKECCSPDDCPYDPEQCNVPTCPFGTCGFQFTCIPGSECCNGGICDPFPCNSGGIGGISGFPSIGGQTFQSRGWDPGKGGAPPR